MKAIAKNSLILAGILVLAVQVKSVRVRNRQSVGDKFTYAENITTTIVDMLTGETNTTFRETTCIRIIIELEDTLRGTKGIMDKSCNWARFTPSDEIEKSRLLFERNREEFEYVVDSSTDYYVGKQESMTPLENSYRLWTVTRIYDSEEYDTEVITFELEVVLWQELAGVTTTIHSWITQNLDTKTLTLLSSEETTKWTIGTLHHTDIIVRKLIKREKNEKEL